MAKKEAEQRLREQFTEEELEEYGGHLEALEAQLEPLTLTLTLTLTQP